MANVSGRPDLRILTAVIVLDDATMHRAYVAALTPEFVNVLMYGFAEPCTEDLSLDKTYAKLTVDGHPCRGYVCFRHYEGSVEPVLYLQVSPDDDAFPNREDTPAEFDGLMYVRVDVQWCGQLRFTPGTMFAASDDAVDYDEVSAALG
jgi:hypothetical protein